MPPKSEGTSRGRGARRARGPSTRGRGARGGAQVASAQEQPQDIAHSAKSSNVPEEDSLFIPKDDPMPDADVSMTDADINSTTEPTNADTAADASAGASRPEDARMSSVRGSQTPAASPAPASPASTGVARGAKKAVARMPTFKGRRSKEEREALEAEAERKRREKLQELSNELNASRGRGDRGRGRGKGDRGGRGGRGGYMGQRGFDGSLKQDMGGVFASGTVNENRSRMIHRGKTFGASHTGGIKRERTIIKSEGSGGAVKAEDADEDGYISSDPEIEILGPRQDVDRIETIDLVSDDEEEDAEMTGAQNRRSRTRFNTPGLAPVRIRRREHENAPRKITAEAPGDPEIKIEGDVSSPRKGKGKAKDVEVTGSQGRWKGAWGYTENDQGIVTIKDEPADESTTVPSDIPEQPVKDTPSSPETSRKTKPKIKQRRKPRFRDIRAAVVSEEDKQEQERHEESMRVLADELGEVVLPHAPADADGDTAMGEGESQKQEQPIDKKADRVYLFQLPPVLPSLMVDDTIKKEPSSPKATSRSNPIDLATPPEVGTKSAVNVEDETTVFDPMSPELPTKLTSGVVGKLRVHKSGRSTLDWGGTSLELSMGMDASFLQDIIVTRFIPEEQRVSRDGGEAMSFGQVCGKFVVTPDWDEIVG